jgi:hypothetical protein
LFHLIEYIRAIERGFEENTPRNVQNGLDIVENSLSSRGGQAEYGYVGKKLLHHAQKLIIGSTHTQE